MQEIDSVSYVQIKTWHPVTFKSFVDTYRQTTTWLEHTPGGAYWMGGYTVWFEHVEDAVMFALMWS